MREELSDRIDRRTGNADLVERRIPLLDRSRGDRQLHMAQRFGAMDDAVCIGAKPGIVDDRIEARYRTELAPEIVVGHPDHDRSIDRLERLIGAKRFMAGAAFGGLHPAFPKGLQIVAQKSQRGVEQRHLYGCPLTRLLSRQQAGQNTAEGMHAGHLIDRRNRTAYVTAPLIARHRHDAAEGLQDHVVAR